LRLWRSYFLVWVPRAPLYLTGTDALGRDVLVRSAVAFRFDLTIGVVSVLTTAVFGLLIGARCRRSGSCWWACCFGVQPPTPEWGLLINEGSSSKPKSVTS
jgi:ABC-type dipeptide/oligopeptide/nickel transport system permease subunit